MDTALVARLKLEKIVRDAVQNERFELHYQPVFEGSSHRLIGFEASARLPAPDGTLIPPMSFIPVAEEIRLIDKIGAWVLREACLTAAHWPEELTVAVNLSPAQFELGSVSQTVADALQHSGLAAHRLELEITKSLLLGSNETVLEELNRLKAMGVAIVMDDFGTGYSSLSYLWRFPFSKIKIDAASCRASARPGAMPKPWSRRSSRWAASCICRSRSKAWKRRARRVSSNEPTPTKCRAFSSASRCRLAKSRRSCSRNFSG